MSMRPLSFLAATILLFLAGCDNATIIPRDAAPGDNDTTTAADEDDATGDDPLQNDDTGDGEPQSDDAVPVEGDGVGPGDHDLPSPDGEDGATGDDDAVGPDQADDTTDDTTDDATDGATDDADTPLTDDGATGDTDTPMTDDTTIPDADVDTCVCSTGACCDGCHYLSGTLCRPAVDLECDIPETCAGNDPDCPEDTVAAPGDPCDDMLFCNGADHCSGGTCSLHDDDPCGALETCVEGRGCLTECETAEAKESYVGCEYWGAFLQNESPNNYAVVVANPNDTEVTVTVYGSGDTQLAQFTVAAYGVGSTTFDTTRHITAPGISDKAFRIVSSRPVTATQMNPYGNVLTYTNDASLLLPTGALGQRYYAMSWPTWYYTSAAYPGFISVVAAEPGTTTVTVTYRGDSAPGTGFEAHTAGETVQYTLSRYQILTLNSSVVSGTAYTYGVDLTGSLVEADKRVAVFGGHKCTDVPADKYACDHLEHQVFPLRSWGRDYVAVRTKPRNTESDYFRILASVNGTSVSWSGGISGSVTLDAGEFHDIATTADFTASADKPIMVAQVLASQDAGATTGDPAMMFLAPSDQFRTNYTFLVAPNYDYDRITVVAPVETSIMLDETPLNPANAVQIPGTAWYRYHIDTTDGAHILSASKPVGLYVYGFSQYVSYAYTAGLDLADIVRCWDANQNGLCDPAIEDLNADGLCTEKDCM